jgi:uncharacterized protein (TIGR04255 family)
MQTSEAPSAGTRIKFTNPPITELVIGFFHLPLTDLRAQHIGIYWDRIRSKYALCQQQSPILLPGQSIEPFSQAPDETFPLPRFWFRNDTHPALIQVQRNAFFFNWRLLPELAHHAYPHYETVVRDFWQELETYRAFVQEFVGGKLDPIQRCELTYINLITPNELFSSAAELVRVLPPTESLYSLQADDRSIEGIIGTVNFRVNPTLAIDLGFRLGRRADTMEVAVGIELKAHGVPSNLSLEGTRAWFDVAHDAIYKLFLDATGKEMQVRIWRPQ